MNWIVISIVVGLIIGPLFAILWVAFRRESNKVVWWFNAVGMMAFACAFYYILPWHAVSHYLPLVLGPLLAVALAFSFARHRSKVIWSHITVGSVSSLAAACLGLGLAAAGIVAAAGSRRIPAGAIGLEFPLRSGAYCIAHGGSSIVTNQHCIVSEPGYSAVRGQRWGLDIMKLDGWGRRASGIMPARLEDYRIFGEAIYAPFAGTVVQAENDQPDRAPWTMDPLHPAGNYVLLRCDGGVYVLLAHMRKGSVVVKAGDHVAAGDRLGAVGNSGNTTEPHLHISAQAGPGGQDILDADPVPILFGNRWLMRNDVIRK